MAFSVITASFCMHLKSVIFVNLLPFKPLSYQTRHFAHAIACVV